MKVYHVIVLMLSYTLFYGRVLWYHFWRCLMGRLYITNDSGVWASARALAKWASGLSQLPCPPHYWSDYWRLTISTGCLWQGYDSRLVPTFLRNSRSNSSNPTDIWRCMQRHIIYNTKANLGNDIFQAYTKQAVNTRFGAACLKFSLNHFPKHQILKMESLRVCLPVWSVQQLKVYQNPLIYFPFQVRNPSNRRL